jgi:prophage endopeptidase
MQVRQRDVASLDAKYTKELADAKLKMMLCSASLIMVAGCSSKAAVQCQPQPKPPAPPAWAMMPPSNSAVAGRNVLGIRSGIISDQKSLSVLQDYIRTQCLK